MAEFDIKAGGKIITLTEEELNRSLSKLVQVAYKGVQYRRSVATVPVDASGNVSANSEIGPPPGFVWSVKRVVIVNQSSGTGNVSLFVNGTESSNIVEPSLAIPAVWIFSSNSCVLYPGDEFFIVGDSLTASSKLTLVVQAAEVEVNEVAKL